MIVFPNEVPGPELILGRRTPKACKKPRRYRPVKRKSMTAVRILFYFFGSVKKCGVHDRDVRRQCKKRKAWVLCAIANNADAWSYCGSSKNRNKFPRGDLNSTELPVSTARCLRCASRGQPYAFIGPRYINNVTNKPLKVMGFQMIRISTYETSKIDSTQN